jgi:hypothetical protein
MIIAIFLRTTGAFAIWYALTYGLSGEQKDPVSHGRKVAAWVAASVVITTPSSHRNGPDLVAFILINGLVWGGVAFVVGYLWRKFKPIPNASTSGNEDMEARVNSGATLNTAGILPAPTLRSTANADIKNTQGVPTAMINDPPIPPDVEAFYDTVGKELEDGKPDRATWTRAFAEADGDDAKARAAYIRLRVAGLMAAYEAEMAAKFKVERSASIEADKFAKSEEIINAEKVAKAESERLALMKAEVQEKSNEQRSRRGKAGGLGALIGGSVVAVLILYFQFHKVPLIDLIAQVCGGVPFGAMIGGLLGWLLSGLIQWSEGVAPRDRKRQ